jgi:hypothetical protein
MATQTLSLLNVYSVTEAQRQTIINAATRSPKYQRWFVEQFTRNRPVPR